jgi:hypothetical protein
MPFSRIVSIVCERNGRAHCSADPDQAVIGRVGLAGGSPLRPLSLPFPRRGGARVRMQNEKSHYFCRRFVFSNLNQHDFLKV